ncbi:YjbH domain-containing protein [Ideonella sp.]|jgi:hypothetical protein|uniref:YjbH domain-containing protein n=1 Tax=Ideonella sp. TaxID=1929293 RepID=UPI0037C13940
MSALLQKSLTALALAAAQAVQGQDAPAALTVSPPPGQRLGAWLTQHHAEAAAQFYEPGLMWQSTAARQAQRQARQALLRDISAWAADDALRRAQTAALLALLRELPITGRLPLASTDPWRMQTASALEPLTADGDVLVLPRRPERVRVLSAKGPSCDVVAEPERIAADVLHACGRSADWVWLVQADGSTQRLGVAEWNGQRQQAPGPGAWLWVPPDTQDWPEHFNPRIAQVLAEQGVAEGANPPRPLDKPPSPPPRDLPLSANDWGMTGLLQTPSARTPEAGRVALTVSRAWPYTQTSATLSPFDGLELAVRYTHVSNKLYGPSIAGDQGYKDKSSEIKLRLLEEGRWQPALALGLRDPGGTGLFAGEYLVASKRWGALEASLGLGWGYLGARGNLPNPLGVLGERFKQRANADAGSGGTANLKSLFTGRTALFGGLQWHTPWEGLSLKAELDGNDYRHEPLNNNVEGASSPVNVGLVWQRGPLALSLGLERGRQWMLGLSLHTNVAQMSRIKSSEPTPWPVSRPAPVPGHPAASLTTGPSADTLQALAAQTGWLVARTWQEGGTWVVELDNSLGHSLDERLDRGVAVLHEHAPDEIEQFQFILMQQGVAISSRSVARQAWAAPRWSWAGHAPVLQSRSETVQRPGPDSADATRQARPRSGGFSLGVQQHLGGPDGYLYALSARAQGQMPLWAGAWAQGTLQARLLDNYERYRYTAPSALPRVRTLVREYLTQARVTLPYAQATQLNRWGEEVFSLAYVGALEPMFAGAGAEVLWRPQGGRWALGLDVNRVAQRDFEQRLAVRDYRVTTGHASAYWDTGWQGLEAKVSVGQYLAGDRGATVEISRRFANGARIGAWVTKTNVSSAAFGEGSFDKAVYVSIPFDAFLSAWSTQTMSMAWQPLIRDGGARLNKLHTLWSLTGSRDPRAWRQPE